MQTKTIIITLSCVFILFFSKDALTQQQIEVFDSPASFNWIVPECVTEIKVQVWGAGGGGGGARSRSTGGDFNTDACAGGAGGGGGGYTERTISVTPGMSFNVIVGAGGAGGSISSLPSGTGIYPNANGGGWNTVGTPGAAGGNSSFSGGSFNLTANGGGGGESSSARRTSNYDPPQYSQQAKPGMGGTATGGSIFYTGGKGCYGYPNGSKDHSSAGGGAAGPSGDGGYPLNSYTGNPADNNAGTGPRTENQTRNAGLGNGALAGNGGGGQSTMGSSSGVALTGYNGDNYGGGGAGALTHSENSNERQAQGGNGGNGAVIITYNSDQPAPPTVNITQANCDHDGSATISGYNGSYTYTFSPSGPTVGPGGVISGASPGATYTVTVSQIPNCTSEPRSFTIPERLSQPANATISTEDANCNRNGTATIINYNSNLTYVFNPSGPSVGAGGVITGLNPSQTYTVTVSNGSCSSGSEMIEIDTQFPTPAEPSVAIGAADCDNDGSATLTELSGHTYSISPSSGSIGVGGVISGNPGTSYTITVTNSNGCTNEKSFTIPKQSPTPDEPTISLAGADCGEDGSATITNYNGSSTYAFSPNGPSIGGLFGSSRPINGAIPGVPYTVTVTNSQGCMAQYTFTVEPSKAVPNIADVVVVNPTCSGNGSASIANYNPSNTYIFNPSGPLVGTGGVITGASFGVTYTVTVVDQSSGCPSAQTSFTINSKLSTPNVTIDVARTEICDGESVILTGTGASTYTWDNGLPGGATQEVDPSSTTTYTVTGTAANGCSDQGSVTITVNSVPTVDGTVDAKDSDCDEDNGSITGLAGNGGTPGYTYEWTNAGGNVVGNSADVNGLPIGEYTLTIIDSKNCEVTYGPVNISNPDAPLSPVVEEVAADCDNDGSASITNFDPSVNYEFSVPGLSVDGSGNILGGTPGQSYTVTAENSGCYSGVISFEIEKQKDNPVVSLTADESEVCDGVTVHLTASGASSYSWDNSLPNGATQEVDPSSTTTYTVTGTAANGCSDQESITITVNPLPTVDGTVDAKDSDCDEDNGSISGLTGNGGTPDYTYEWTNAGGTVVGNTADVNDLAIGEYTLTIIDSKNCEVTYGPVNISNPDAPAMPIIDVVHADCDNDGSVSIDNFDGSVTYEFSDPNLSVDGSGNVLGGTPGQSYTVSANKSGCSSGDRGFTIEEQLENPDLDVTSTSDELCEGGSYTVTVSGADSYVWADNLGTDATIVVDEAENTTTYTVVGSLANGCEATESITVTVNANPTVSTTPTITDSDCGDSNGSATGLEVSGGEAPYSYSWTNTSGEEVSDEANASDLAVGTYTYRVTDANGCTVSDDISISNPNAPEEPEINVIDPTCEEDGWAEIADYDSAIDYVFNNPNLSVDANGVIQGGTPGESYTIASSVSSCESNEVPFTFDAQLEIPTIDITTASQEVCAEETIVLTASGASTYTWGDGLGNDVIATVSPEETTTYTVTGEADNGCENTTSIEITVHQNPEVNFEENTLEICDGDDVTLTVHVNSEDDVTYTWSNADGSFSSTDENPTISPVSQNDAGEYTVSVVSDNGCHSNDATIMIIVNPLPEGDYWEDEITACFGKDLTLTIPDVDSSFNYSWTFDDHSLGNHYAFTISPFTSNEEGEYYISVLTDKGCATTIGKIEVTGKTCSVNIVEIFSPNGDGINDYFHIDNLDAYPNTEVWIYTRWGLEVFHSENYQNDWDGTSQSSLNMGGEVLPEGTYYYVLKLGGDEKVPDSGEEYKGFIYLKR